MLPDATRALYPFKSHFLTLSDGKRMHYVDEGPENGEVLVFAHGYPMWSFEFRALLVYYAAQGFRCIAMDHVGYGLSDKPTNRRYHTLRRHIHNLMECIQTLNLKDITLVMEDWGGPLGLGYAIRYPDNIKRLVVMNSWVFQDTLTPRVHPMMALITRPGIGELLLGTFNAAIHMMVQQGTVRRLSSAVIAGYRAPFKEARSRQALIQFPRLFSTTPTHPSASMLREIETELPRLQHVPTLILWGRDNPVFMPGTAEHWKVMIPRARGPIIIDSSSHYLPEDDPEAVIRCLDDLIGHT